MWSLIWIPCSTALIGWLTNVIAVRMLFRPRTPRSLLGLKIQGLIPKRRAKLAHSLAQTFAKDILSVEELAGHLKSLPINEVVQEALAQRTPHLTEGIKEEIPMAGLFLSDEMIGKAMRRLQGEVEAAIPSIQSSLVKQMTLHFPLQRVLQEKLEGLPLDELEGVVQRVAKHELRAIEWLGGVIGLLIGVLQLLYLAL